MLITLKGEKCTISGNIPPLHSLAPNFRLTDSDLNDFSLSHLNEGLKIFSILPSIETGVCALSTKKFNQFCQDYPHLTLYIISRDLPFTQKNFQENNKLFFIQFLSSMRDNSFGDNYGIRLLDGPLENLLTRSIFVLNSRNEIIYYEIVSEISQEPNYENLKLSMEEKR